jgi:hypothetical protein
MAWLDEMDAAPSVNRTVGADEARFMKIERRVRVFKEKWRILPPGIENETSRDTR